MSNSDERRWQQRLDTFGTALTQLTNTLIKDRYHPILLRLYRTLEATRAP